MYDHQMKYMKIGTNKEKERKAVEAGAYNNTHHRKKHSPK
jgi:hypothetical protein